MPDSQAKKAWNQANTTRIVMNLNHRTDADILDKLSQVTSKQGYIKSLIRSDLAEAAEYRRQRELEVSRAERSSASIAQGGK